MKIITENINNTNIIDEYDIRDIGADRDIADIILLSNLDHCEHALERILSTSVYLTDTSFQILSRINTKAYLNESEASFMAGDIYSVANELDEKEFIGIVEIGHISRTLISSKGDGSILLSEFLKNLTYDNVVYVARAQSSWCNEFTPKDIVDKNHEKLVKFYEKLDFVNINDSVRYENSVAMIWCGNKIGKYIYNNYFINE